MKIVKYGTVTISENKIGVQGFLAEPEASDPADATPEQLLLNEAIKWARRRFENEVTKSILAAAREKKLGPVC